MDGVSEIEPFVYPALPHNRKHGPSGYSKWGDYKDWLRDEFDFRCVYCLKRETWELRQAIWSVEHLIPRKDRSDLETNYGNLVLACGRCNSVKGVGRLPDPCKKGYGSHVKISENGEVTPLSTEGQRLIRVVRLDDEESTEWRRKWICMIRNVRINDPNEYPKWMGFPSDLPDLSTRSVKKNSKPKGAQNCRFIQRSLDTLPETY